MVEHPGSEAVPTPEARPQDEEVTSASEASPAAEPSAEAEASATAPEAPEAGEAGEVSQDVEPTSTLEPEPTTEAKPGFGARARAWLRRMLFRLAVAALLFLAGFAVAYYKLSPAANQVPILERKIAQLENENASLQERLQALEAQLQQAQAEAQAREQALRRQQAYAETLAHLYAALSSLQTNDAAKAKARLALAVQSLEDLQAFVDDPKAQQILKDVKKSLDHLWEQDWSTTTVQRRAADILLNNVIEPLETASELFRGSE
ncbi:MAG: hypothetical protein GXO54_04030 [Chloroflexi bacterium]|nr:hypothetical protein [Chloroflexota bacterium]